MTLMDTVPATGRRVTPSGRLVLPSTASREEWLEARRGGICSSDMPPLLEVTEYGTPVHVYYEKSGELPELDAGEAAFWGNQHEDTVARVWAMRNRSAIRKVGLIGQDDAPWRMCTLDRRVTVCPLNRETTEACALEVKTRSAFLAGKWKREIPDDVLGQVLWQILVTGYSHIHVAVLIGGNDYRQATVYRADYEELIADLATVGDRFWHEHVVPRRAPRPSGNPAALVEVYDALHPMRGGDPAFLDRDLVAFEAAQEYLAAGTDEKAAVLRKDTAKAVLIGALGDADTGVMGDLIACTYKQVDRTSIDAARLAERWPEAYDDCARTSSSRRFELSRAFRKKWGN